MFWRNQKVMFITFLFIEETKVSNVYNSSLCYRRNQKVMFITSLCYRRNQKVMFITLLYVIEETKK